MKENTKKNSILYQAYFINFLSYLLLYLLLFSFRCIIFFFYFFYTEDYFSLYYYYFLSFEQRLFFTLRSFISRNIFIQRIRILKTDGRTVRANPFRRVPESSPSIYVYMYIRTPLFPISVAPKQKR